MAECDLPVLPMRGSRNRQEGDCLFPCPRAHLGLILPHYVLGQPLFVSAEELRLSLMPAVSH